MKQYPRVVPQLLVFLLFASAAAWSSVRVQDEIGAAIALPDGTQVTLTGEQVLWRGASDKSFAIKEWMEPRTEKPRLVVVSHSQLSVREGWSVDVTGVLGTYTDRDGGIQRVLVVSPADVLVYCSPNGKPCSFIPVKQSGIEWENKTSLVETAAAGYAGRSQSTFQDGGLPPLPDPPEYVPLPLAPGSRDSIKLLPDGAEVALNGVVVSTSIEESGYFYAERSDRSSGICVVSSTYVYNGQPVDITGYMATWEGERCIVADTVEFADYQNMLHPRPRELFAPNRSLIGPEPGANTTGLLVRTSGRVIYRDIPLWIIDDGSAPLCGWWEDFSEIYGVIVVDPKLVYQYWPSYDPGHTYPDVGDYVTVTGSSGAMLLYDPYTYEPLWTIPIIIADDPVDGPVALTRGTCSGTVSGSVPDGAIVRVYSGSFSTTATFDDGIAAFQGLSLPTGDNSVTASLVGYKTVVKLVTIAQGQNTSVSFELEPLPKYMDLVSDPARIEPGSTGTITVTAIVRDKEGRRLPNEPVTWNTDIPSGRIVSAETSTDVVGEARMVIQPSATASTATVTATSGELTGRCFPEFAEWDAPRVWITAPARADTVSDVVETLVVFEDVGGQDVGVSTVTVLIDGVEYTSWPATINDIWWQSNKWPNGSHQITATARDREGNVALSNVVNVTVQNPVSEFSLAPNTVGANESVHVSAHIEPAGEWTLSVTDEFDQVVWSTTGTGNSLSADWPGTSQAGLYTALITVAGTTSPPVDGAIAVNITDSPAVLLIAEQEDMRRSKAMLQRLGAIAKRRNLSCVALLPGEGTWERIKELLSKPSCQYLYISCHGQWNPGSILAPVTQLQLTASKHMLYGHRWDQCPPDGATDPSDNTYRVAYADTLNRGSSPLKFVFIDACYSGRIGANRPKKGYAEDNGYYGNYGMWSCYEINSDWNDMAAALGITATAASETACGYVGWYDKGWHGDWRYTIDPYCVWPGLIIDTWEQLASSIPPNGYPFEFTRQWIEDNRPQYRTPKPDDLRSILQQGRATPAIASFFNWRFFGNPYVKLF